MTTDSQTPESREAIQAIFRPLEARGFPTDTVMKAIDSHVTAATLAAQKALLDRLKADIKHLPTVDSAGWWMSREDIDKFIDAELADLERQQLGKGVII